MTKNNSKVLLQGTMILAVSGMVVKVIGSLNWIFLSRILGGEGIGLYQMGFPIYLLALTLSSAGIPVAISILTAEKIAQNDYPGAQKIFTISSRMLFITGLVFMLLMLLGANLLVEYRLIRDPRAYWSIIALAPAVFLVTFMSSMRGYLQGWQKMAPTAASEIIEQLFRVVTMIAFAWLLLPYGLEYGAAGASMGAGAGAFMALILLWLCVNRLHRVYKNKFKTNSQVQEENDRSILKRIFILALPISLSSLMLPIVANLDMMIVPMRLEVAGFDIHRATELFGYLTGMAVPLINLATLLTAALAIALVPSISESRALEDAKGIKEKSATAFRISNAITIPASVAIYLLAEPIAGIVYNSPMAGPVIQVSSISIFFLGLHQVSTGVLQGLSLTRIPVIAMIVAAIAKVVLNWQLVAIPYYGIKGAAWATIADMALAAIINMYFIWKHTGYLIQLGNIVKTVLAASFMAGAVLLALSTQPHIGNWSLLLAVASGAIVYTPLALLFGALPISDASQIPIVGRHCEKLLRIKK